ncbi:MAG: DUF4197 domain-containing protein [Gammaproteobacteria bacterium]|nr:MAG: DUF4197 domain-containing protein [Gammaproteobacteria bacterium]
MSYKYSSAFGTIVALCIFTVFASTPVNADWKSFLQEQLDSLGDGDTQSTVSSVLSNDEMIAGLKQALEKGVGYAVENLGQQDGFWGNQAVRIPMPEKLETVEKALRSLGQDKYADEFVLTMNRAAESAVPLTKDILKQAVTSMSFEDAKQILKGPDDAATQYLRKVGGEQMSNKILPIVQEATSRTGVTQQYKNLFDKLGFMNQFINPEDYDIDRYVTNQTLDGIFHMIAQEEKQIRENPLARSTDLLKKVFGASF